MLLLASQVWQCLDLELLDGAEFLAEQLVANNDTPDTRFMLGYVQNRRGQHSSAIVTCEGYIEQHVGCLWVFSQACLKLDKITRGLNALDANRTLWWTTDKDTLFSAMGRDLFSPSGFFLLYANLHNKLDHEAALEYYTISARLNPFLFENVRALAKSTMAVPVVESLFTRFEDPFDGDLPEVNEASNLGVSIGPSLNANIASSNGASGPPTATTGNITESSINNEPSNSINFPHNGSTASTGVADASSGASEEVPKVGIAKTATSTPRRFETPRRALSTPIGPQKPQMSSSYNGVFNNPSPSYLNNNNNSSSHLTSGIPNFGTLGNSINKSGGQGIFQTPSKFSKQFPLLMTGQKQRAHGQYPGLKLPGDGHNGPNNIPGNPRVWERAHSLSMMLSDQSSLSSLGKNVFAQLDPMNDDTPNLIDEKERGIDALGSIINAMNLMSLGEFKKAIESVEKLADPIQESPFVLALTARLFLETGQYEKSIAKFESLRKIQPDRCRDMEYYSTSLWHAKRDYELALLANDLCKRNSTLRSHWQSWCALGNSFSLRNDTNNAIKCFQRATQIDPDSAYAYTLMGYEYCSCEELQDGAAAFAKAIQKEPSLYNAWYGLGTVSYGLGDFERAETFFRQAIQLNLHNPVLICYLGTVYEALGDMNKAMMCFDEAGKENPDSPIPRFRKAEALINAYRFKDALDELLSLEYIAPEDSSVHLAIARAYRGLGHNDMAVQQLTIAQNLAPNSTPSLRNILETM